MIIYKATNKINNKCYIGQTIGTLDKRIKEHIRKKDKTYFHNAIKKYGIDNFRWTILEVCMSLEELNEKEIYYIKLFNSFGDGYNLNDGGGGMSGYIFSDETKEKMRKLKIGKYLGSNNPFYGKTHTEEVKKKISENNKGKPGPNLGRKMSDEQKEYLSKINTGKKISDETKKKLSISNSGENNGFYGKKHSEETKRKISEFQKGRKKKPFTDEHKRKISEFQKGRKKNKKNK